jgi:hypothetical protein
MVNTSDTHRRPNSKLKPTSARHLIRLLARPSRGPKRLSLGRWAATMMVSNEIDAERYLTSLSEPDVNVLRLVIEAAHASGPKRDVEIGEHVIRNTVSIVADESTPAWEVVFSSYIAYGVRNESFTTSDEDETFVGKRFVTYEKSKFLEFVRTSTFADETHPGPFVHYGIFCLDHIVDVVSTEEPEIRRLRDGHLPS